MVLRAKLGLLHSSDRANQFRKKSLVATIRSPFPREAIGRSVTSCCRAGVRLFEKHSLGTRSRRFIRPRSTRRPAHPADHGSGPFLRRNRQRIRQRFSFDGSHATWGSKEFFAVFRGRPRLTLLNGTSAAEKLPAIACGQVALPFRRHGNTLCLGQQAYGYTKGGLSLAPPQAWSKQRLLTGREVVPRRGLI